MNVVDMSVGPRDRFDVFVPSSGPPEGCLVGGRGDKTMLFYCIHPSSRGLDGVFVLSIVSSEPSRIGCRV